MAGRSLVSEPDPAAAVESEVAEVARRIRRWRTDAGMTLQSLAERSGLATSTIQKIETFQMSPSVAVLLKVARGLDRSPGDFMSVELPIADVVHLTARERRSLGSEGGMVVERLSGDLRDNQVEVWRVELAPGRGSGREPLEFRGEEFVLCECGELSLRVGDDDYRLESGDVLHFKATLPHKWRNESDQPVRFLLMGTVPPALREVMRQRVRRATHRGADEA